MQPAARLSYATINPNKYSRHALAAPHHNPWLYSAALFVSLNANADWYNRAKRKHTEHTLFKREANAVRYLNSLRRYIKTIDRFHHFARMAREAAFRLLRQH